jgi:hypothetical protein
LLKANGAAEKNLVIAAKANMVGITRRSFNQFDKKAFSGLQGLKNI